MSRRGLSAFRSLLKFNATQQHAKSICDVKGVSRQLFFFIVFFVVVLKKKRKKNWKKKSKKLDDDDEKEATFITPI